MCTRIQTPSDRHMSVLPGLLAMSRSRCCNNTRRSPTEISTATRRKLSAHLTQCTYMQSTGFVHCNYRASPLVCLWSRAMERLLEEGIPALQSHATISLPPQPVAVLMLTACHFLISSRIAPCTIRSFFRRFFPSKAGDSTKISKLCPQPPDLSKISTFAPGELCSVA